MTGTIVRERTLGQGARVSEVRAGPAGHVAELRTQPRRPRQYDRFAPYTAVADRRIKAVASVSGLPYLRRTLTSGFGGDWHNLMTFAQSAREAYAAGGEPQYVPFLPPGEQGGWVANGREYYLTDRNPDANWQNQTLVGSFDKTLQYSALDIIHLLAPTPVPCQNL